MKAFSKLLSSSLKQFVRERAALFWSFAFPILFILIFGAVFSNEDASSFSIGLVVEDNSPAAQGVAAAFNQVSAFNVQTGERQAELDALQKGNLRAVLVIGQGFERAATNAPQLVQMNEKTLQSQRLRFVDYLVPGILAMAIMQLGLFAAIPLVVERQNKVLKRLGATPLRRSTMIGSVVAFRLVIALVQAALIILVARLVFNVPMLGNWLYLSGMVVIGTMTFLAMGYMLSAFAKTEDTVMPLIQVVQMPMMFLSGIFWPVEMMPGFMRPIIDAMPLTYFSDSLRQIMVSSAPFHTHTINVIVLAGWLVFCLIVAVRFFKWE